MIQAGVGYAGGGSAEGAARTAAKLAMERAGLDQGDLAFVFATTDYRGLYGDGGAPLTVDISSKSLYISTTCAV